MMSALSVESSSQELRSARTRRALLVFGGAEQCGPCLPCNIDTLLADFLAQEYAENLGAFRLPTIPFNTSQEHGSLAGTLSFTASMMQTITTTLIQQLQKQGYSEFVILSPHGGSHWENSTIKELNADYSKLTVISAKDGAAESMASACEAAEVSNVRGMHGGLMPLYITAFLRPDLVRPGSYGQWNPEQQEMAFNYGLLEALSPDGCWGDPIEIAQGDIEEYRFIGKKLWTTFAKLQSHKIDATLSRVAELRTELWQKNA
ncbi:creatininase family protein [Coraliomargarita sp. W4R53]